jgi:hypothetical protein
VHGASIGQLLENLKLHEFRARDRTRRELRGRDADEVIAALDTWVAGLDASDPNHEHHLLEALWVTWGLNRVDADLLRRVLASADHRARAAAVQVARYTGHQVPDRVELLRQAANDEHGRVRLGAVVAASWLDGEEGLSVLAEVEAEQAEDLWLSAVFQRAGMTLRGEQISNPSRQLITPP